MTALGRGQFWWDPTAEKPWNVMDDFRVPPLANPLFDTNFPIPPLDTSPSMVYRARQQLVEEGLDAVLSRKQRATPAVARIFDGEKRATASFRA
jgi:hypothetical protein